MEHKYLILWTIWNTFLALIPVGLGQVIPGMTSAAKRSKAAVIPLVVAAAAWLAFLPNTCYLLTEWRHFLSRLDRADLYVRSRGDADVTLTLMLYTVFYFCYSAAGMLAFALAIRPVARLFRQRGASMWVWGAVLFAMLSVGVYLGLVLRYNSWDLLVRPGLVWDAAARIVHRPMLSGFVILFAAALWIAYTTIDIWLDGLAGRWKEWIGR